jgi:hypothetical protein
VVVTTEHLRCNNGVGQARHQQERDLTHERSRKDIEAYAPSPIFLLLLKVSVCCPPRTTPSPPQLPRGPWGVGGGGGGDMLRASDPLVVQVICCVFRTSHASTW